MGATVSARARADRAAPTLLLWCNLDLTSFPSPVTCFRSRAVWLQTRAYRLADANGPLIDGRDGGAKLGIGVFRRPPASTPSTPRASPFHRLPAGRRAAGRGAPCWRPQRMARVPDEPDLQPWLRAGHGIGCQIWR